MTKMTQEEISTAAHKYSSAVRHLITNAESYIEEHELDPLMFLDMLFIFCATGIRDLTDQDRVERLCEHVCASHHDVVTH